MPLEEAHRPVAAKLATLESGAVLAGHELGEDVAHGLPIEGVNLVHERLGEQRFLPAPEHARERAVRELRVSVEPNDAERFERQLEGPHQLVAQSRLV